jgi:hypothetical protein
MARAPDERYSEAYNLFRSGKKLIEIANQLNLPEGTVRRWKSTHNWEDERSDKKSERSDGVSWIEIEKEYVTDIRKSPFTLKDLSKKYNLDYDYLRQYAASNDWKDKRLKYITKVSQKAVERSADKDADRILRLLAIADTAASKAEQSLNELETYLVTNKKKTKIIEYKDASAPGKPTKEVVDEEERIETTTGPIDRQGLLFVTSSLKNIKDLYAITNTAKMQEHTIDMDNKKLELAKAKAQLNDNNDIVEDDGFLDALSGKVDEIWSEE